MSDDEIRSQIKRLKRYVVETLDCQKECDDDEHECHWIEHLEAAQSIVARIESELDIRQGEKLLISTGRDE